MTDTKNHSRSQTGPRRLPADNHEVKYESEKSGQLDDADRAFRRGNLQRLAEAISTLPHGCGPASWICSPSMNSLISNTARSSLSPKHMKFRYAEAI